MQQQKILDKTEDNTQQERFIPQFQTILIYTYRFHYLNTIQIQKILNHKSKSNVILWLNYLSKNKYLKRYYVKKLVEEPAAFSLGTMGRKYFLEHKEINDINIPLLDRVWKESKYSVAYRKRWMLVGDIYLSLLNLVKSVDKGKGTLSFFTAVDLTGVQYMIHKEPDAYFTITDKKNNIQRYFLDIVKDYAAEKRWKARIKRFFDYYNSEDWQRNMKQEFPEIIFVCPNGYYKNKLNEFIKEKLSETNSELSFYLTTKAEIKYQGMTSGVLHKVEI